MEATEESAEHCTPLEKVSRTDQNRQREKIDGQYVLEAFIAVIHASPLATAAVDRRHHLSAVAGLLLPLATLFAELIVAAIAAAALGGV